jgi:NADPH-dependent 2,4-dienoyl-CoA reductase/sulfur reductase-like enzyme
MRQTTLIIGAGQAGGYAAIALRDAGFQGRITLIGTEPHRPYERPPLSKDALTAPAEPTPLFFHAPEKYAERDIELRLATTVDGIDPKAATIQIGAERPAYDHLLLTTGGRARPLTTPGGNRAHLMRTIEDAIALRPLLQPGKKLVCIGAGVIGLETAASAKKLGCDVTIVEAAPRPMARSLTPELSAWLATLHRSHGIDLHLNATVDEITETHVHCAGGPSLQADIVIAGIGMIRNTSLAEDAGITCENGILTDANGRTSHPNIHAAGDVAAAFNTRYNRHLRLETWRHAMNHGTSVARNIAGHAEPYDDIPWFWTDQHNTNLQQTGLLDDTTTHITRGTPTTNSFAVFHCTASGEVHAATGINAPRDIRAAQELIKLRRPVDPARLADPATNLQKLVAELRK